MLENFLWCASVAAIVNISLYVLYTWSKSTDIYKSVSNANRLLIIGTAERTLKTSNNDVYAILAHRGQDSVRTIALNTYTFQNTMKYVTETEVEMHLACHGHMNGRVQFDDQSVSAWQFIEHLDNQVINTLLLMACHGEKFATLVHGVYVKNVVCVSFDHEVPDDVATEIASEFWRCMSQNKGNAKAAFNETKRNLSLKNANRLHLFTNDKDTK